jgi:hypothetical protein
VVISLVPTPVLTRHLQLLLVLLQVGRDYPKSYLETTEISMRVRCIRLESKAFRGWPRPDRISYPPKTSPLISGEHPKRSNPPLGTWRIACMSCHYTDSSLSEFKPLCFNWSLI